MESASLFSKQYLGILDHRYDLLIRYLICGGSAFLLSTMWGALLMTSSVGIEMVT